MSIIRSLVMFGLVAGVGSYYYDASYAPRITVKAPVTELETDIRCRQTHESMCKYFATVLVKPNLTFTFRIPQSYYHQNIYKVKETNVPVVVKQKKIWGPRILSLEPKEDKKVSDLVALDQ